MRRLLATLLLTIPCVGAFAPRSIGQAPTTGRIEGRVTGQNGEPVPAAEVWVQSQGFPVAQGRTDASGAFVLARVPFGTHEVCAGAPGQVTSVQRLVLDAFNPLRTTALMLPTATRLSGRVTDGKGAPVASARVIAASTTKAMPPESAAMTVTDATGRYALDTVPQGSVRLLVMAPGYKSFDLTCTLNEPGTQDVVMLPGGRRTLCLRLKNATPEQLAVAQCTAVLTIGGWPLPLPLRLRSGVPDARGEWRLDELPADIAFRDHSVRVPGASVRMLGRATSVEQVFTAEFTVQPATQVAVQGMLVDASSRPLAGHALLGLPDAGPHVPLRTDVNGAFTLPVNVSADKIVSADPAFVLRPGKGADPKSLVLMAMPAVGISCKISDAQGRPVRGADVVLRNNQAVPRQRTDNQSPLLTATDAKGVVAIHRLSVPPANQPWVLEVRSPDGNATSAPFELPQSGVLELPPLQLTPCGTICGTVRDAAGNPVPFAVVNVSSIVTAAVRATSGQTEPPRSLLTDRNGNYRCAGLYEGAWAVTFVPLPGTAVTTSRAQLKGGSELVVDHRF